MHRLVKPLFWILVFGLLLVAMDQLLTRLPAVHPAHTALSEFYRDFRARLFSVIVIPDQEAPPTVEAVIEQEQSNGTALPAPAAPAKPVAKPGSTRFVYADAQGVLQFADSLESVPREYRASAEPLQE